MCCSKVFFSIIIPVFNTEKYLARCFNSIKSQSFSDYEVLLINDGSVDNSDQLCKEYAASDGRVKYFLQENLGVSSARNKGLREATGSYICFLDADDSYEKTYLESFYSLIEKYKNTDLFFCGYKSIRGTDVREVKYLNNGEVFVLDRNQSMQLYESILLQSLCNKVFRKSIIEEYRLQLDESISLGEDLLFNLSYMDKCSTRVIFLNETLYNYFIDTAGSLNKKYRPDLYDTFVIISDKMGYYFRRWSLDREQMEKYYNAVFSMMVNSMRNTFRLANTASYREKILFNNGILRSERFKEAVKCSKGVVHPIYKVAYSLNDYRVIRLLDKMYSMYVKHIKR